ncbi:hypothetical protein H9P43_002769 [Blastocladiella emersonii ATCC 22665]|nr:hypothetical protein H9P43_002769 [Blastocladiella emersonii ATCC 22665]
MVVYSAAIPILPEIVSKDLGLTSTHTGVLVGIYAAGLLIFTPIFGYWSDWLGTRKTPVIMSLIALCVTSALYLVATEYWHYLLVRVVQGIAAAGNTTVSFALAGDVFPQSQLGAAMGVTFTGFSLGSMVGPTIGGLLYDGVGHRAPFVFFMSLTALNLLLRFVIDETPACSYKRAITAAGGASMDATEVTSAPQSSTSPVSLLTLLKARPIWLNTLAVLVLGTVISGLEPILPPFLTALHGTSVAANGLFFLALSVPGLVTGPIAGHLCDRFGSRPVILFGIIAVIAAAPLIGLRVNMAVTILTLLLLGAVTPISMTPPLPEMGGYVDVTHPGSSGQVYAIFNMAYASSLFVGPVVSGALYEALGMAGCMGLFSGLTAVVGILYAVLDPSRGNRMEADDAKKDAAGAEEAQISAEAISFEAYFAAHYRS